MTPVIELLSFSSLINSRGVVDELVWEEEVAAREAGYGATSSVPKVSPSLNYESILSCTNTRLSESTVSNNL